MTNWTRPWLRKLHPNFFLIFVVTACHNSWAAVNGFFGGPALFSSGALENVNAFATPRYWAVAYLFAATCMVLGLFRKSFGLAKFGLAVGLGISMLRFFLLALAFQEGGAVANSLPNLLVVIGVHCAQLLEPPVNPVSSIGD